MPFDTRLLESDPLIFNDTLGIVKDGEVGVERGKRGVPRQVSPMILE